MVELLLSLSLTLNTTLFVYFNFQNRIILGQDIIIKEQEKLICLLEINAGLKKDIKVLDKELESFIKRNKAKK